MANPIVMQRGHTVARHACSTALWKTITADRYPIGALPQELLPSDKNLEFIKIVRSIRPGGG